MKKIIIIAVWLCGILGTQKALAQDYFLGQIIPVAFEFAPRGWAQCNGQLLSINQNQALFALLGTTYGGNGITTFALPDLRGRMIVGVGQGVGTANVTQGQSAGTETTSLLVSNLPNHVHAIDANSGAGTSSDPTNHVPANTGIVDKEYATTPNTTMGSTGLTGGNVPIANMKPYTPVFYVIALQGVFPSRN